MLVMLKEVGKELEFVLPGDTDYVFCEVEVPDGCLLVSVAGPIFDDQSGGVAVIAIEKCRRLLVPLNSREWFPWTADGLFEAAAWGDARFRILNAERN